MKKIFFCLSAISIIACQENKEYKNKEKYSLSVGETVEIYYSTNSCCHYAVTNKEELQHIKFVEDKVIDSGPKDCDGCDYTAAFVFKAESKGTDTVELKRLIASQPDDDSVQPEKYIIEIKE